MKKKTFYSELAYILGVLFVALGTALVERADFGVSMVVAPAYIIYLKVSQVLSFFTFGMAEYLLQGVLILLITVLVRKFRISYFFSFITAVIYAFCLDGFIFLMDSIPFEGIIYRYACYVIGLPVTALGVAVFFKTYISPEAYELFVKEISFFYKKDIHKFKTFYDCASCIIAIILSLVLFRKLEGIGAGTIICALINGHIISFFSSFFDKHFIFKDKFDFRKYF